jgi:CIC family chloride channel protein
VFLGRRFLVLNGTALAVGALAGLAAVAFRWILNAVQALAFSGHFITQGLTPTAREDNGYILPHWGVLVILVPAIGGLLVGLIRKTSTDMRQYGVTEVMAAGQSKGGVLRARTSWGHAAVSAITVGTGGSTGREGPIGYIGAAFGSSLGRRAGLGPRDVKVLLGAGLSSGIATSFNAPLGGVLMALELVVPEFSTHAFIPLVIATVAGVTMGNLMLAGKATFLVPAFSLHSPWELVAYLALGLLCGALAVAFIRLVSWSNDAWMRLKVTEALKPALGGLMVGVIGYAMFVALGQYHVFGTGYATITDILQTPATAFRSLLPILLLLLVAKPIATTITIGSGGGGGMFSVSLFQGALVGGLVGLVAHAIWPATEPSGYALIGMVAFYAASTRATLTAIVIVAELTRDYDVVLPAMLAAVAADAVSVRYSKESLYTLKLAQKGILYEHDRVTSPLETLQVKQVMTRNVETLDATTSVGAAFGRMTDGGHTGYPVVSPDGRLTGIVTRRDLAKRLHEGKGNEPLSAVVSGALITAYPDEMLHKARDRMFQERIGRLMVVDPSDRLRLLGIITRSDLLSAEAQQDVEHEDEWSS